MGGAVVQDTAKLFGSVRLAYQLSDILDISYESEMRFILSEVQLAKGLGLGFCFRNIDPDIVTGQVMTNCFTIQNSIIPEMLDTNIFRTINGNEVNGDKVNLALKKPAVQMGVYGPGDASRAVDGSTYPYFDYDIWSKNTGMIILLCFT
jgi:hypothetical protein